ncbi:hypothetical protein ACFWAR_01570 [Streptomyces sp. NPDC059917]|uniref:hypothetical protein n=1 Tax=Streptomyces sp. NPDC059917 TaxID=3347002 RepID=UPI0036488856
MGFGVMAGTAALLVRVLLVQQEAQRPGDGDGLRPGVHGGEAARAVPRCEPRLGLGSAAALGLEVEAEHPVRGQAALVEQVRRPALGDRALGPRLGVGEHVVDAAAEL